VVEPWGDAFYFAHSFVAESPDTVATSEGLSAAVQRGSFLGCSSTRRRVTPLD